MPSLFDNAGTTSLSWYFVDLSYLLQAELRRLAYSWRNISGANVAMIEYVVYMYMIIPSSNLHSYKLQMFSVQVVV